ncbi:MAG: formate--tetrahydrofolate ligase [Clostridia bacterium]|nr:formate--tetrahydrofolate ligase [Clostridia bacterium]
MKSDIEISREASPKNIIEIANGLGLNENDVIQYGKYKAKLDVKEVNPKGKLILVTAINPTKSGIGKTTVSIGLADALTYLGKKSCLALREPSLGPVFGVKGGATGGGYSQIIPMEDINLHFNGDFHAITSANNLLCSLIDNHIFQGNSLNIDSKNILFNRCMDLNERALRDIICETTYERKERFIITSASEIMAILCMAENLVDLKKRLGNIMVALDKSGKPVYARDLHAEEAMAILLKDAIKPNLVQTLIGTPAIVHCGPFANIAHGCNSVIATKLAMTYADYTITEAGFGADLGAEKFIDFKCREAGIKPDCVVLVATIRAIKLHGGESYDNLAIENVDAVKKGVCNLIHHIGVIKNVYKLPVVVTLNKFESDTEAEIEAVVSELEEEVVLNEVWGKGGNGATELARKVVEKCKQTSELCFAYEITESVENKIKNVVTKIYGGKSISFSDKARKSLQTIYDEGLQYLPIIMAKTQFSLSADKNLIGAPRDFNVEIKDIEIRTGAGFLVVVCGAILLMPALGKAPSALQMTIDEKGKIDGLF